MIALALLLTSVPAFTWHDLGDRVELRVNDKPFFVYNAGAQLAAGAPDEKRRCCYVHPVYAPNGAVVTDDFPKDHWHHRGIFWSWPSIRFEGKQYDVWTLRGGIEVRSISVKHYETQLEAENGWFIGTREIVSERVRIRPQSNERIHFDLTFEAVAGPVELAGAPEEHKGYGGFSVRFAPREETVIRTDTGVEANDTNMVSHKWAELSGTYNGKRATLRIDDPAANGWCLRNYGFLGVNYPGLKPLTLTPGKPLRLAYQVTVANADVVTSAPRVLVYTRNYTPDGKGYVHQNIPTSIEAIRQLGHENGFQVDATDDPTVFTPENLKKYRAIVFSNSNNEAFTSDTQRDAFKQYVNSGGGLVGIHSASGSERAWPYFWSVMGGKFLRHPKLQKFTIQVTDPNTPITPGLPASFEWEDECYYQTHLNPDIHVLLATDRSKLVDPKTDDSPEYVNGLLPLAWMHQVGSGRVFYVALGHKNEHYSDPTFRKILLQGIEWAMGARK